MRDQGKHQSRFSDSEEVLQLVEEASSESEGPEEELPTTTSQSSWGLDTAAKGIPLGQLLESERQHKKFGRHAVTAKQKTIKNGSSTSTVHKRQNKNRPMELSSKKPVSKRRKIIENSSRKAWDPRFSETPEPLEADVFKKRYAFIYDDNLPAERAELVKTMKKTKSKARKQELHGEVARIQQQLTRETAERRKKEAEKSAKANEKEAVKQGKKPFYLKRSEKRRQELIQRYQDLKASGGLQKAMAKKRKKNAAKDHRYVPSERRS